MPCCSSIPTAVDKELDDNGAYLETITKALKNFEKSIAETLNTYQVLMGSFEKVARAFAEVAGGASKDTVNLTHGFEQGMRKLRDGPALSSLQTNVTRCVKDGLPPLLHERDKAYKLYKRTKELKKVEDTYRFKISEMERSFAAKNRSLVDSKSYAKLGKSRENATIKYQGKKQEFITAMNMFKTLVEQFLGVSLPGYATCTSAFSRHLGQVMEAYTSGELLSSMSNGSTLTQSRPKLSQKVFDEDGEQMISEEKKQNPLTLEEQYYQTE